VRDVTVREYRKIGDSVGEDADLRAFLRTLRPPGRDTLRRVLTRDQPDRDAISSRLIHRHN